MSPTNEYKKKERLIEAIQLTEGNLNQVASWCDGIAINEPALYDGNNILWAYQYLGLDLKVNGYMVRANIGDYVYRNHKGLFRTMTFERFMRKYDRKRDSAKIPDGMISKKAR